MDRVTERQVGVDGKQKAGGRDGNRAGAGLEVEHASACRSLSWLADPQSGGLCFCFSGGGPTRVC